MQEKRCELNLWEDNKEMPTIDWRALYSTFGAVSKHWKVAQNFRMSLDEKTKNNLKLPTKYCKLEVSCFLRFFPYRQGIISKLKRVSTYTLFTNNPQLTRIFLTINTVIWKFQVLMHNSDFRIGICFSILLWRFLKKMIKCF